MFFEIEQVLKHLKNHNREAKVIVMTAHEEYEKEARELGCDIFLVKPFAFDHLEKSIRSLLMHKDHEEIKSYSLYGQMNLASAGSSVADIMLVEPIEMIADAIGDYLRDPSKAGGYYRVYTVDTLQRATILQSPLRIHIALIDLRTNQDPRAIAKALLTCDRPPLELITYFNPADKMQPDIAEKVKHWSGNPLEPNDLAALAKMIHSAAQANNLVKR